MSDGQRVRGIALTWSEHELDVLAVVTDADVRAAVTLWRRAVAGPLADLLEAAPSEAPHA